MKLRFIALATEGTLIGSGLDRLVDGEQVVAGRERGVELLLPDISVSKRHFAVKCEGDGWTIEDLDSRRGTAVNDMRLSPHTAVPLRVGDEITAGIYKVIFKGPEQVDQNGIAGLLARQVESDCDQRPAPCLRVLNGPAAGACYVVRSGEDVRLGRGEQCEVILDDARVSRLHGVVRLRHGRLSYLDLGSSNGSLVNGHRVRRPVEIDDGAELRLGRIRLVCEERERDRDNWLAMLFAARAGGPPSFVLPLAGLLLGLGGLLLAMAL